MDDRARHGFGVGQGGPACSGRRRRLLAFALLAAVLAGVAGGLLGVCGPFTDVAADAFCPFVLEIFYLGITTGTTPTTYSPSDGVTRLQMAAFLSRAVDGVLRRGSRRAALNRFWISRNETVLDVTTLDPETLYPAFDGLDVWVPTYTASTVARVRASDGRLLETWTGATNPETALSAIGKIFITGGPFPGNLYRIDPRQPAGAVTTVASNLGDYPYEAVFDGQRIWTANLASGGSVSIVTPGASIPWTVTTVTAGFSFQLRGALFDGSNVWVTAFGAGTLLKLDSGGAILQTVTVGSQPFLPVFDSTNIWVPNFASDSVSVVRASSGVVLATLTGNGLSQPTQAAFDGERVLVTNHLGNSVSLWKAADLNPITSSPTGGASSPLGACSDGADFWITFRGNQLGRF